MFSLSTTFFPIRNWFRRILILDPPEQVEAAFFSFPGIFITVL